MAFGVTVNVAVPPTATVWTVDGLITPSGPALGVTANVAGEKVAATVHGPVIVAVVNVVPARLPPHVPPTVAANVAFGVTVKESVDPCMAVCTVEGPMVPFAPALGVTL